jgi:serine/threonine-protein kinase HipA
VVGTVIWDNHLGYFEYDQQFMSSGIQEALSDPKGFSIVEYAYYLMAIDAGIDMAECRLFKENGRSHFMTKRFDRLDGGEKVHMQSLCGLAHYDFNQAGAYSYEQAIGVMRDLQLPKPQFEQFFRRMVFNIVARNQDDHTKNIRFLMDKQGQWCLSPGYDITHCYGEGWTKQHQMTVNSKRDNFTLQDLLAVAEHADISKANAAAILGEVVASVSP